MLRNLLGVVGVSSLLIIASLSAASAADMPLKAPPLPAPVASSWAGWYVGVNGGGGWERTTWTFPTDNFYDTAAGQSFGTRPSGGLVGGQVGYNWQFGQWVVGAEFMGDWADLKQTLLGPVTPVFPLDSYTTELRDLETLTARIGYAPGNWLLYGKAGVATGTERLSVLSGAPVAGVQFTNSMRRWGPTGGVGVEYMVAPHLIVGVEYDYAALSSESINTTAVCTVTATCGGFPTTPVSINSGTFGISTVVGRLSYKFDWGGPIATKY